MRSETNVVYEKPAIQTVSAAELIEMVGPVQGYAMGGGSNAAEFVTTPFSGGGSTANFGR